MQETIQRVALYAVPFLFSLCFHEFAHAWTANKLGDPTAKYSGRLSLNPLVHIDIIWTVLMPLITLIIGGIFFGGAKPVPVDTRNFRNQDKGMAIVAFAGPLSNIILAILFSFIFSLIYINFQVTNNSTISNILTMLQAGIIINLFLAFFNLMPIPPLDGSRIVKLFLSHETGLKYYRLEPYSFILIIIFWRLGFFKYFVGIPATMFYNFLLGVFI